MFGRSGSGGSASEAAERMQRKRTRIFWMEGLLFVAWQGIFLTDSGRPIDVPMRLVDGIRLTGFLAWAAVLLLLLATGGGMMMRRDVRALMHDESTVAHRRSAFAWGYWALILATLGVYGLSFYEPLNPFQAVHLMLTCGIAVPLLRFAWLERRAERG